MKAKIITVCIAALAGCLFFSCTQKKGPDMTQEFTTFLAKYEANVVPLSKETAEAYFNATISGKPEDYKKYEELQVKLTKLYTNKEEFAQIKKIKESETVADPQLKRQLDIIYLAYLGNQVDQALLEEMIKMQVGIENKFSTFRASANGKKYTDNEIEEVLSTSNDSKLLQAVWEASKESGKNVAEDLKKLVQLRNRAAKQLGYANYHEMSLKLSEQDPEELSALFDELDNLTGPIFAQLKKQIDSSLAKRYNVAADKLMPWHYQNRFFQEAPKIYEIDLDTYYKGKDIAKLTSSYFAGIGMPIDDMLAKSDLYEKPGKYQHAYCTNIDRQGDVRVVCNIKPNEKWMGTMLHEFGHAIYEKYMDNVNTPWTLRQPAHIFTTEAIAELFGRMSSNAQWMQENIGISKEEKAKIGEKSFQSLRLQMLVFSRWAQVMYRFEKAMYANPEQDLNALWWSLVEKYQMIKKPEGRNAPDYASKIHVATVPCYYHNYLLGELLASQWNHYIFKNITKAGDLNSQSWTGNKKVGQYFIEKVFKPAASMPWNEMIEKSTGEKLTAKYYAEQFVK